VLFDLSLSTSIVSTLLILIFPLFLLLTALLGFSLSTAGSLTIAILLLFLGAHTRGFKVLLGLGLGFTLSFRFGFGLVFGLLLVFLSLCLSLSFLGCLLSGLLFSLLGGLLFSCLLGCLFFSC